MRRLADALGVGKMTLYGHVSDRADLDAAQTAGRAVRRVELVDADFGAMRNARDVDQQVDRARQGAGLVEQRRRIRHEGSS